jgi:hypothetical protein
MRSAYKILFGKLERKIPLEIHKRRREDNINNDFTAEYFEDVNWIQLTQAT